MQIHSDSGEGMGNPIASWDPVKDPFMLGKGRRKFPLNYSLNEYWGLMSGSCICTESKRPFLLGKGLQIIFQWRLITDKGKDLAPMGSRDRFKC